MYDTFHVKLFRHNATDVDVIWSNATAIPVVLETLLMNFLFLTRVMNIAIQYLQTYEYFVIYEIVKQSTGTCNFPHVDTERNQDGVEFGEALKYRFPILS